MMQVMASLLGVVVAIGQADGPSPSERAATKSAAARTPTPDLRIDSGVIGTINST
jgi:hypothetical protein